MELKMYKVVVVPLKGSLHSGFARVVSYLASQTRLWSRESEVGFAAGGELRATLTLDDYYRMRRWVAKERSDGRLSDCDIQITNPEGRKLKLKEAKVVEKKSKVLPLFEAQA